MLSTVFSVMFCILNCYLASLVIDDMRVKAVCTVFIFGLLEYIIIDTTFVWDDMSSHTRTAIAIAIIYTLILIPIFGKITNNIINETLAEAKISFQQRNDYRKMFNALQEGIIVIEGNSTISFMNELSNKVFSELSNMSNFFKRKAHSG